MTGALAILVGEAWALAAGLQLALWALQLRTRNAGIVDVGWALAFVVVIAWFAAHATTPLTAWAPIASVTVAWSLRLGGYLIARGAARAPEDGRYADLRARWAPHAARRFFVFFQAQAGLVGVLSTAVVVPFVVAPWDGGGLRALGAAISVVGIAGEALADAQLARWKRAHPGAVCDAGLWRFSRHPNYFFEWCVWLGHAVYGLAFWPCGLIAIVPQALLLCSILFVTGIPPTEKQSLVSRGDLYRAYQARVSKFIPWPPKRS
jgi:steroid 5-alpha reductase family enzyme